MWTYYRTLHHTLPLKTRRAVAGLTWRDAADAVLADWSALTRISAAA